MGGPPPVAKPKPLPPMPSIADPAVAEEAKRKRILERNAGGRASTILTGNSGVQQEKTKKTTLGGA